MGARHTDLSESAARSPAIVSIVTPTLNAARFLRQTLSSVARQTYSPIEHIVVDGGSSDETAAIVAEFPGTRFISAPGQRQAAAINRGVSEAGGDVVLILSGDDLLEPQAVSRLAETLSAAPHAIAAYGDGVHIDEANVVLGRYPTRPFDSDKLIESCYICQPASAIRRGAFLEAGGLDEHLDVALDYDLWIRLARRGPFAKIDDVLAASRMHRANKTLSRRRDIYAEVITILRRHFGYVPYTWAYAYANWLIERNDQFFAAPRRRRESVGLSLLVGLWLNKMQPLRYVADWYAHRSTGSAEAAADGDAL